MIKFILNIVQILIGVYWAGNVARQNPKIDSFVAQLELGYNTFNQRLKDVNIREGLAALRRIYGWAAIAAVVLLLLLDRVLRPSPRFVTVCSTTFLVSFFGWFSIKWCAEHRKTVSKFGPQVTLMVFGPLLMGPFDILMGTSFVRILAEPLYRISNLLGWHFSHYTNPMAVGVAMSVLFLVFFSIYYTIFWILSVPAAFLSATFVALPVLLARFVHTIAPKKAFFGFTVLVFTAATLWQLWL